MEKMTPYQKPEVDERTPRLGAAFDRCNISDFAPLHLTPDILHIALHSRCEVSNGTLKLTAAGRSYEGRTIYSVSAGNGPVRVLLWSQMHGDESTATRALGDIFNHIAMTADEPATKDMLTRLTLLALPMLNPDGAERRSRRNAQGVDVNRDALALRTPEGRLLAAAADAFKPSVSFNLHDQELSTTGDSSAVTAIALLAPACDALRSDNPSRILAKKIASSIARTASHLIPGRIARYDDSFEPRAFGDTFQKKGYGTVLVESGHAKGDPEKMQIRKVNFIVLLAALEAIADGSVSKTTSEHYDRLPSNSKRAYDVIVRNVTVRSSGASYRADLGISRQVDTHSEEPARLVDVGDLGIFSGLEEFDGTDAVVQAADLALNRPFDYRRLTGG